MSLNKTLNCFFMPSPVSCPVLIAGNEGTYAALVASQVVLSIQLPFALIPLVRIVGSSILKRFRMKLFVCGCDLPGVTFPLFSLLPCCLLSSGCNTRAGNDYGLVSEPGHFEYEFLAPF